MHDKLQGWLLIGLSLLVASGFVVKQGIYWEIIDIVVTFPPKTGPLAIRK